MTLSDHVFIYFVLALVALTTATSPYIMGHEEAYANRKPLCETSDWGCVLSVAHQHGWKAR